MMRSSQKTTPSHLNTWHRALNRVDTPDSGGINGGWVSNKHGHSCPPRLKTGGGRGG